MYHKAEDLNDDDNVSMYVHSDDFMVELRIDVFQAVKVMSERKVDIEVSTIIGLGQNTKAKIVKQISSQSLAGITWVRLEQSRAAALTLERAKAKSLPGGTAIYLVLSRLDIAYNINKANRIGYEALIERIVHETVAAKLTNAGMISADKKPSSLEEPEFVWTFLYREMTQKSVRKADTNRTDQDSEDHKCFSCVIARLGDRVIDVGCAKQDVIALQCELCVLTIGGASTIHTNYLDRDRIKRCITKMGMMIAGAWVGEQLLVVSGTGVIIGEDLIEGQSWTIGVVLLVAVGVVLGCACIKRTRGCTAAELHDFETMRAEIINHVKKKTWSISRYSGDQLRQLMVMMNARYCRVTLAQFLRRIDIMSEEQTMSCCYYRVCSEFFFFQIVLQVALLTIGILS